MKDKYSPDRVALLHPKIRQSVEDFINEAESTLNISLRIVQGLRTFKEQDGLYQIGRTIKGSNVSAKKPLGDVVTNSPAGASYHNYGLAIDICPIIFDDNGKPKELNWNYDFKKLAPIADKYGLYWGGNFSNLKDLDHFENKFGYNWRDLLKKYQAKDFIPNTQYVNI